MIITMIMRGLCSRVGTKMGFALSVQQVMHVGRFGRLLGDPAGRFGRLLDAFGSSWGPQGVTRGRFGERWGVPLGAPGGHVFALGNLGERLGRLGGVLGTPGDAGGHSEPPWGIMKLNHHACTQRGPDSVRDGGGLMIIHDHHASLIMFDA